MVVRLEYVGMQERQSMAVLISLPALHRGEVKVSGALSPEELQLDTLDPCQRVAGAMKYRATCQLMGPEVLVEGALEFELECQCVRCLTTFRQVVGIDPWACLLPLEGEDAAPRVDESVDLTPQMREDSLLALPQHPVCSPECRGVPLQDLASSASGGVSPGGEASGASSAWSALDALKLDS